MPDAAGLGTPAGREAPQLVQAEAKGGVRPQLIHEAGMTQPAVARFEAGGTVLTLPVLQRLARALDADLTVTCLTTHRRRMTRQDERPVPHQAPSWDS